MLLFENISLALNGLRANKTRSILTMLGIIIGIASVIAIMTIGNSMTASMNSSMASLGATDITIGVSQKSTETEVLGGGMRFERGPRSTQMEDEDLITDEMLEALKAEYPDQINGFKLSEDVGTGQIKKGQLYANVAVTGANETYLESEDLTMLAGRKFLEKDQSEGKKVCIISDYSCNNMYDGDTEAAVGQQISVVISGKYYHYTVVGVYEYDSSSSFSTSSVEDTQTNLYLPLKAAFDQEHKHAVYSRLDMVTDTSTDVTSFLETVSDFLNDKYYRKNKSFEIECFSLSTFLEEMQTMMRTTSLAITFIAGISLLVGGIGVMNIMLVSIQERTKEIGTRKALGATNGSIRIQFIVESIVLCLVGGFIGIAFGIIIGAFAAKQMGYEAYPSLGGVILSVGFSMAIGVFFGYYPANKAAKMNPVEALRYE